MFFPLSSSEYLLEKWVSSCDGVYIRPAYLDMKIWEFLHRTSFRLNRFCSLVEIQN